MNDCGHTASPDGFAADAEGRTYCYGCASVINLAARERRDPPSLKYFRANGKPDHARAKAEAAEHFRYSSDVGFEEFVLSVDLALRRQLRNLGGELSFNCALTFAQWEYSGRIVRIVSSPNGAVATCGIFTDSDQTEPVATQTKVVEPLRLNAVCMVAEFLAQSLAGEELHKRSGSGLLAFIITALLFLAVLYSLVQPPWIDCAGSIRTPYWLRAFYIVGAVVAFFLIYGIPFALWNNDREEIFACWRMLFGPLKTMYRRAPRSWTIVLFAIGIALADHFARYEVNIHTHSHRTTVQDKLFGTSRTFDWDLCDE